MSNWTIKVDVDTGDDDETESVIDDIVWEGLHAIAESLRTLDIDPAKVVSVTDPHGNTEHP